jgi:hypothetical protein
MYNQTNNSNPGIIGLVIPAYGFYDRIGNGLAEDLVNIFEKLFALLAWFRR